MGCFGSKEYHEQEYGIKDNELVTLEYKPQPADVYDDLDTDNDQKGRVAVDHIFKPTREVYGQVAKDLEDNPIDWNVEYKLSFVNRPSPSDFPAFAHQKEMNLSKEKRK